MHARGMTTARLSFILVASMAAIPGLAEPQSSSAAEQGRTVPARQIPVPTTVSPQLATIVSAPPVPPTAPQTAQEWKAAVQSASEQEAERIAAALTQFAVTIEPLQIAGVPCFAVNPPKVSARNAHRVLLHLHGGAYVFGPGRAGTLEAILVAGTSGMRVISVDYRMPPDHPFPAAMDDSVAVWKALTHRQNPSNMAVFGTSTGGAMTLALVQAAQKQHLPLPAAIASGTPWSDLTNTGDSYFTNEGIDNALVSYEPVLGAAARLYAGSVDLKDPRVSPVYGSFHGFPPTLLTTGTRDLFLSNTVRVHRKLREAGVDSRLEVYEAQSHAQYLVDPTSPESKEALRDIASFFDAHLGT